MDINNYDAEALKAAVKEAVANSGVIADLTARLHELTNPQPTPSATFSDEEKGVMVQAVADYRKRKAEEAKQAQEDARMKEWAQDLRNDLIRSGRISPETDAERKLWRDAHGYEYKTPKDLRQF